MKNKNLNKKKDLQEMSLSERVEKARTLSALSNIRRLELLIELRKSNPLSWSDLKDKFNLNSNTLNYHLNMLEKAKLIERRYTRERNRDTDKRDYSEITLSEKGSDLLKKVLD